MTNLSLPSSGFGTFRLKGDQAYKATQDALDVGFRHIDTAQIYENEDKVGQAIQDSDIPRDEIFLTTKVWFDNFKKEKFIDSVQDSLDHLKVSSVDLLLIHWPSPENEVPMTEYLEQLARCKQEGFTKNIGVSNFTKGHIDKAIEILGERQILTNQIEVHPLFNNHELVQYCQKQNILITAYMPLAVGKVMENKVLKELAEQKNTSPASIALAWLNMKLMISIPSSTNKAHMADNLAAKNIVLTDAEIARIDNIDHQDRIVDPDFAPKWD
uniref:2,5-didehydrogluconate reductase DkgB n=1 Tax=Ningiella ruwaisensis TaxID=2364274 RepID=UPI00109FF694|nr:2,5-didehydrogluconate reductase DkgB [Ningiella ruwaisensis]